MSLDQNTKELVVEPFTPGALKNIFVLDSKNLRLLAVYASEIKLISTLNHSKGELGRFLKQNPEYRHLQINMIIDDHPSKNSIILYQSLGFRRYAKIGFNKKTNKLELERFHKVPSFEGRPIYCQISGRRISSYPKGFINHGNHESSYFTEIYSGLCNFSQIRGEKMMPLIQLNSIFQKNVKKEYRRLKSGFDLVVRELNNPALTAQLQRRPAGFFIKSGFWSTKIYPISKNSNLRIIMYTSAHLVFVLVMDLNSCKIVAKRCLNLIELSREHFVSDLRAQCERAGDAPPGEVILFLKRYWEIQNPVYLGNGSFSLDIRLNKKLIFTKVEKIFNNEPTITHIGYLDQGRRGVSYFVSDFDENHLIRSKPKIGVLEGPEPNRNQLVENEQDLVLVSKENFEEISLPQINTFKYKSRLFVGRPEQVVKLSEESILVKKDHEYLIFNLNDQRIASRLNFKFYFDNNKPLHVTEDLLAQIDSTGQAKILKFSKTDQGYKIEGLWNISFLKYFRKLGVVPLKNLSPRSVERFKCYQLKDSGNYLFVKDQMVKPIGGGPHDSTHRILKIEFDNQSFKIVDIFLTPVSFRVYSNPSNIYFVDQDLFITITKTQLSGERGLLLMNDNLEDLSQYQHERGNDILNIGPDLFISIKDYKVITSSVSRTYFYLHKIDLTNKSIFLKKTLKLELASSMFGLNMNLMGGLGCFGVLLGTSNVTRDPQLNNMNLYRILRFDDDLELTDSIQLVGFVNSRDVHLYCLAGGRLGISDNLGDSKRGFYYLKPQVQICGWYKEVRCLSLDEKLRVSEDGSVLFDLYPDGARVTPFF